MNNIYSNNTKEEQNVFYERNYFIFWYLVSEVKKPEKNEGYSKVVVPKSYLTCLAYHQCVITSDIFESLKINVWGNELSLFVWL